VALIGGRQHVDLGRAVKAVDSTGAGDCFVGAVAALLADGQPLQTAFGYANMAASICVQRMGAAPSMPTAAEVAAALSNRRPGESRDP
jgi:ribokinase